MNEMNLFQYGAHDVRTITINNEPWFVLADLCRVLGLSNSRVVAQRLDDDVSQAYPISDSLGRTQNATIVNESGMYEVVLRSDKPEARQFRWWITHEVLPQIRKTGAYGTPALTEDQIVQQALAITHQRVQALEAKVKQDAPKVLFADSVATSNTTILVGELAKILKGNGVDIGATRLFARLREDGYLIRRQGSDWNMPTQRSMDLGLFEIKETAVTHSDGHVSVNKTPKVTGKGQAYFVDRYLRELVRS